MYCSVVLCCSVFSRRVFTTATLLSCGVVVWCGGGGVVGWGGWCGGAGWCGGVGGGGGGVCWCWCVVLMCSTSAAAAPSYLGQTTAALHHITTHSPARHSTTQHTHSYKSISETNGKSVSKMAAENFCLKWNDHHSVFFSNAEKLCHGSLLTDVVISASGTLFQAHKLVLSVCSTFFQVFFMS